MSTYHWSTCRPFLCGTQIGANVALWQKIHNRVHWCSPNALQGHNISPSMATHYSLYSFIVIPQLARCGRSTALTLSRSTRCPLLLNTNIIFTLFWACQMSNMPILFDHWLWFLRGAWHFQQRCIFNLKWLKCLNVSKFHGVQDQSVGAVSALYQRQRTGRGCYIDVLMTRLQYL